MKYIIGIIIGVLIASIGAVYAQNKGMEIVNELNINYVARVYKIYDNDNQTVCYMLKYGNAGGISCLK